MRQIIVLAVVSAATVFASPGVAGAELVAPASGLGTDYAAPLATGPGGRALAIVPTSCPNCSGGSVAERGVSGHWTLGTFAPPDMFPALVAWEPGGAATLLTLANTATGGADAFVVRRPAGAARFEGPVAVDLGGTVYDRVKAASDARGDLAFITAVRGSDSVVRAILVTADRAGRFGAPQRLAGASVESAAVAVGGGRVVVAYATRRGVYARAGALGSPLGAAQLLVTTRDVREPAAAIDDAGEATVAFSRRDKTSFEHALVAARARPGDRFGAPMVLERRQADFGPVPHAAAAGTTTALIWQTSFSDEPRVRAAIARGAGRFARPEIVSAPGLGPNGLHGQPYQPTAAVAPSGDVLLAYGYGGAAHATMRPADGRRFGPIHVISKLGGGGSPSVGVLSDGRPLVVYHGGRGELLATTHLTGPSPDLTPPRVVVKLSSDAREELRATNAVTVTVRCSEPCVLDTHASLRTHDGRTTADGVARRLLRRGASFTERFAFDPDKRAGRAGDGAHVSVTVQGQNASGASSQPVRTIDL